MWGLSTDGILGRPPPDLNKRAVSFMPTEVDYFFDKKVIQVACGEKFTVAVTIDPEDEVFLSRNLELNKDS